MKKGIYYHTKTLKMVEFAWVEKSKNITVWSWFSKYESRGFLCTIQLNVFKKYFEYLGEV